MIKKVKKTTMAHTNIAFMPLRCKSKSMHSSKLTDIKTIIRTKKLLLIYYLYTLNTLPSTYLHRYI